MSLATKQMIFTQNVAKLIEFICASNHTCTLGEAWRTPEQAAIYAKSGKGILKSLHCERLAIDLNLFKDGEYLSFTKDYEPFGVYWESLNPANRWGGRFTRADGNHFEMQNL